MLITIYINKDKKSARTGIGDVLKSPTIAV